MVIDLLHPQLAFQPLSDEQDSDGADAPEVGGGFDDDDADKLDDDDDENFEAAGFSVEEGDEQEP